MNVGKYRIVQFDQQIGIGVAGSWHVSISAVAKCNGAAVPYCLPQVPARQSTTYH